MVKTKQEKKREYKNKWNKTYRNKNKEIIREKKKTYRDKNKEVIKEHYLKIMYGVTKEEYNKMYKKQGGVCAICRTKSKVKALSVDHNHKTGEVRKLLCNKCNFVIGLVNEDKSILLKCIKYLEDNI